LDYARKVAHTPAGSRHDLLFWAACRCGELVACGQVAPDVATRVLAARILALLVIGCGMVGTVLRISMRDR
jgi:hypothetical protein